MSIRQVFWGLGLLGNSCPVCGNTMDQKGHDKAFTRFVCTNPICENTMKSPLGGGGDRAAVRAGHNSSYRGA